MFDDVLRAEKRPLSRTVEAGEQGGTDFELSKRNAIFDNLMAKLRGYALIPDIYVTPHFDRNKEGKKFTKLSVTSERDLVHGGAVYCPPTEGSPARIDVYLEAKEISNGQFDGLVALVDEALKQ